MVLIENCKGRSTKLPVGGPERLLGKYFGPIYSKCCSAMISKGNQISADLAKISVEKYGFKYLPESKEYRIGVRKGGITMLFQRRIKTKWHKRRIEVDLEFIKGNFHGFFELKDDAVHDSKKVDKEVETLMECGSYAKDLEYEYLLFISSFYSPSTKDVRDGMKHLIPEKKINIFTGEMLCNKLRINYDDLVKERNKGQKKNINYFIKEVVTVSIKYYPKIFDNVLKNIGYRLEKI